VAYIHTPTHTQTHTGDVGVWVSIVTQLWRHTCRLFAVSHTHTLYKVPVSVSDSKWMKWKVVC